MVVTQHKMLALTEEDARDAWALRAGAELWKAVVAECGSPAADTQEALQAVREALVCARRLRFAHGIPDTARRILEAEYAEAAAAQIRALQQWGHGRGLHWGKDWGTQWGEALSINPSLGPAASPLSALQENRS